MKSNTESVFRDEDILREKQFQLLLIAKQRGRQYTKKDMNASMLQHGDDNFKSVREANDSSFNELMDKDRKRGETEIFKANDKTMSSANEFRSEFATTRRDKIQEIDEEAKNIQTIDTMCPHVQKLFIIVKK